MSEEKSFWQVNPDKESSEYHLELVDPTGWHSATVKWDGCVNLWKYHNVPLQNRTGLAADEHREMEDYIHYCRPIDDEVERLQALKKMAIEYFATHGPGGYWEEEEDDESVVSPEKESIESIHNIAFAAINQINYWNKYGAIGSTDSLKAAFEGIINLCEKQMKG